MNVAVRGAWRHAPEKRRLEERAGAASTTSAERRA